MQDDQVVGPSFPWSMVWERDAAGVAALCTECTLAGSLDVQLRFLQRRRCKGELEEQFFPCAGHFHTVYWRKSRGGGRTNNHQLFESNCVVIACIFTVMKDNEQTRTHFGFQTVQTIRCSSVVLNWCLLGVGIHTPAHSVVGRRSWLCILLGGRISWQWQVLRSQRPRHIGSDW